MDEKLDYHFGNEEIMSKYAKVSGDRIVINTNFGEKSVRMSSMRT